MGVYCYGPLDLVSNIILNTLWYEHNFPASKQATLSMVSTACLWRVASRSLYGLVSRLLVAGADLRAADPYLLGAPNHATTGTIDKVVDASVVPSTGVVEAYAAAFHTDPIAQQEFLGSSDVRDKLSLLMPINVDRVLSHENLNLLSMAILESTTTRQQKEPAPPNEVSGRCFSRAGTYETRFLARIQRVSNMVEAALDTFNRNKPSVGFVYFALLLLLCFFSVLHFRLMIDHSLLPVVILIVHTAELSFHGRDIEFEKLLRGEQLFGPNDEHRYTNDAIIWRSQLVDWVHGVDDDAVYANYSVATGGGGGPQRPVICMIGFS
ncbi:hypothetical protein PR202_ga18242 [Eleusine coracana subsp. coracana]|uniref:PIR2-like helical domain-containing protein n=1 Tax=Eleusine coracana subsp. coracana TaxID=191504 RepID=A0AAV5CSV4_ELECO|nr:hypothetical protein PR202_ga18242 [Eleusine coracana subsp. coracana]